MLKPPTREIQDTADSFNAGSWNIPMQPYVAVSFGAATSLEVAATAAAKGRSLEILQRIQEWCCERSLAGWLRMIYIQESMMIALEKMYRYSVDCRCEKELLYFEWSPPWYISFWHFIWHSIWHIFWHFIRHVFGSRRAQRHAELVREEAEEAVAPLNLETLTWQAWQVKEVDFHKTKANMGILR